MATFTVTTRGDVVDANDGVLSLREAVTQANALPGLDQIVFDSQSVGPRLNLVSSGLTITDNLRINGDASDGIAISVGTLGGAGEAAFTVTSTNLALTNITIGSFGASSQEVTALEANDANVNIRGVRFTNIDAPAGDHVVQATGGSLTLSLSEFVGNQASNGGSVLSTDASDLTLDRVTFNNNENALSAVDGDVRIAGSAFIDNARGGEGGAMFLGNANTTIQNTTIAGNTSNDIAGANGVIAGHGGGIAARNGSLDIINSTITGNGATGTGDGGGVFVREASTQITNSLVLGNFILGDDARGPDVAGRSNTANSIFGEVGAIVNGADTVGVEASDIFARTAMVPNAGVERGVPGNNGGPTPTVALLASSSNLAINAADPGAAPDLDQRGQGRIGGPDVGSFELQEDVGPLNRRPVAQPQSVETDEDEAFAGRLTATDPDGDALRFSLVDAPANGTVVVAANGNFTYTPNADFSGSDSFTFRANDGAIDSEAATVGVTVIDDGISEIVPEAPGATATGTAGADVITGLNGNERLIGLGGNDTIDGAAGADIMEGGPGDDRFTVDNRGDQVIELAGEGFDRITLISNVGNFLTPDHVEQVVLSQGVRSATPASTGSKLAGVGNDNVFFSGPGTDFYDGNDGRDTLSYENAVAGVEASLLKPTAFNTGGAGTDKIDDMEILIGSDFNDILVGGQGVSNDIFGGDGNDIIVGFAGPDSLSGGAGADRFQYNSLGFRDSLIGSGEDTIVDFESGVDVVDLTRLGVEADAVDVSRGRIEVDVTGNGAADFAINFANNALLAPGDILV